MNINGVHSGKCLLNCRLPYGSIMSPLSLTIYMIPNGRIRRKHGLMFRLYAIDDVKLLVNFDHSDKIFIQSSLKSSLSIHDISLWMTSNSLKINRDQTQVLHNHLKA